MSVECGKITRVVGEREKGGGDVVGISSSLSDTEDSGSGLEPEMAFWGGRLGASIDTLSP